MECGLTFCLLSLSTGTNKLPALEEMEGNNQEMTEEEWTQRVAELNKHQVGTEYNAVNLSFQVLTNYIMFF